MQDGLKEAIAGLASNMPDAILSGCILTNTGGTNYSISSGFLKWGGVIYRVPGQAFTIAGGHQAIAYKVSNPTNVPVEYLDGSLPVMADDVVVYFKGAAVAGPGEKGHSAFNTAYTYHNEFGLVFPYDTGGDDVAKYSAYWTMTPTPWVGTSQILRVRRFGDWLEFDGHAAGEPLLTTTSDFRHVLSLPALLRPATDKWLPICLITDTGNKSVVLLNVRPNGGVYIHASDQSADSLVSADFSGLRVYLK